ncbi:MAG: site-specific integrase, partial [Lachnospiraceae bacterium]|nr:site-specific integrase [Lachnospiraceae bacterium]
ERNKYLSMSNSVIWQGKNGRYMTYVDDVTKPKGRRLLSKKTLKELEDAIVKHYKEQEMEPTIKDVFFEWANSKLSYGEIEKQTFDRYETDFYRFFKDCPLWNMKFRYIDEIKLEELIYSTIHDMNLSAKGWANMRLLINGMFKYAKKKGYTTISITNFMGDLDLSKKIFRKVIKKDEDNVFTNCEIEMIVERMRKAKPSVLNIGIMLSFQTGLRIGELAGLKYSDLNGKVLTVQRTEVRYKTEEGYRYEIREFTKGEDGIRAVVMTEEAINLIKQARRMNPFSEYLFSRDGERVKAMAFTKKLYRICEQLHINKRSAHKARKTYGTKLLRAGVSDKIIEKQMGHTDIDTTRGYYYYNDQTIDQISEVVAHAMVK